jgi:hypothetical protein
MSTTESKPNRLTDADYIDPANSQDTENARGLLLEILHEHIPEFLDELATAVFPHYKVYASCTDPKKTTTEEAHYRATLRQWATRFQLREEWLLEQSTVIMDCWLKSPADLKHRNWFAIVAVSGVAALDFTVSFGGWNLLYESCAQFKERAHWQLNQALAAYEKDARELAQSEGYIPARHKFSRAHIYWFALFQFRGWTYRRILDELNSTKSEYAPGDESSLRKGLKTARQLLDWKHPRRAINREK